MLFILSLISGWCFSNKEGVKIYFHEPHPSNIVKTYTIKVNVEDLNPINVCRALDSLGYNDASNEILQKPKIYRK